MSFGNLKFFNWFHILQRFAKNWVFSARYARYESFQMALQTKSVSQKSIFITSYASFENFEIIHFIDWFNSSTFYFFLSKSLNYVALKYSNSIHKLDQFAKSSKFPSKLIQLWRFEVNQFNSYTGSICKKISAVTIFNFSKLFPKLLKHKKNEKNQIFFILKTWFDKT